MTRRRLVALVLGAALAGLLLTACGGGDDEIRTSAPTPPTTGASATTDRTSSTGATTAPATVAPDAAGVDLQVVFVDGGKVATGHRRVAPTRAVARAALEQLIAGPNPAERDAGFSSLLASATTIDGLSIADGVATVDLSPTPTGQAARAQVVYTLTQFPTVQKVRFGPGGPLLTRADFRDVTPLVFLESVAPGDIVSSPVTVAGESNTFEATVRIRVLGADGAVLADTFTTATSGTGTWGTFSEKVAFAKGANSRGTVVVFWDSPKDGSPQDVVEVPVAFSP
jgi:hypothetical protein